MWAQNTSGADGQRPFAGSFQGFRAVRLGEAHDAQTRAEALLGVASIAQDHLNQHRRVGPDLCGPSLQTLGRPFGMPSVTGWHVIRDRRVLAIGRGSDVGGNALTLMEYLHRPRGEPDPDLLTQQVVRGGEIMLAHLDVIVEANSALLPLGKNIRLGGQWLQGRSFDLVKYLSAAGTKMPGHTVIQAIDEDVDRRVQLGQ